MMIECPHCHTRVLPMQENLCPSCLKDVSNVIDEHTSVNKVENKFNNATKFNYANFINRVSAFIIDSIVFFGMYILVCLLITPFIKGRVSYQQQQIIYSGAAILIGLLYFSIMESSANQATIGKRKIGIYVTDLNGDRITFLKAIIREFIKSIGSLILLIYSIIYPINSSNNFMYLQLLGDLLILVLPKKQALHDVIAGTIVLRKTDKR